MPPKKGKKGKKSAKKDDLKEEASKENTEPTEKEILLQQELDQINASIDEYKAKVGELRRDNEWLQMEAQKVRVESHEYMSYMDKKTSKRQTTIISLSDQNQKQINTLKEQKKDMLEKYQKDREELSTTLLEKECQLKKIRGELKDLNEYEDLQKKQQNKIKELEKKVMHMRGKHSEEIQQLKAQFLKEKRDFQLESEGKVATLSRQANKEAVAGLESHTQKIKTENRQLRHKLLVLIKQTRALHEHRADLEKQKKQLLTEQQYANDLRNMRSTRQHNVFKRLAHESSMSDTERSTTKPH